MSDVKQTIAVIGGTGGLGSALAFQWGQAGYKIIIGSRNAEKALLSPQNSTNAWAKHLPLA